VVAVNCTAAAAQVDSETWNYLILTGPTTTPQVPPPSLSLSNTQQNTDLKSLKSCITLHGKPITQLRSIICHMKSNRVTRLPASDLPIQKGRKAELILALVIYRGSSLFRRQSHILVENSNHLRATQRRVEPTTSQSLVSVLTVNTPPSHLDIIIIQLQLLSGRA